MSKSRQITRDQLEEMLQGIRAENAEFLQGRGDEAARVAYHAAMYSMRRLTTDLVLAGFLVIDGAPVDPGSRSIWDR